LVLFSAGIHILTIGNPAQSLLSQKLERWTCTVI
jgi:hypothetical protein